MGSLCGAIRAYTRVHREALRETIPKNPKDDNRAWEYRIRALSREQLSALPTAEQ